MSKRKKGNRASRAMRHDQPNRGVESRYREARRLAEQGQHARAVQLYERLSDCVPDARLLALTKNDLAALAAAEGDIRAALKGFRAALAIDRQCEPARLNLALVEADVLMGGGGREQESTVIRHSSIGGQGSSLIRHSPTGGRESSVNRQPSIVSTEEGPGQESSVIRQPSNVGQSTVVRESSIVRAEGPDGKREANDECRTTNDEFRMTNDECRMTNDDCPPCLLLMVTYNRLEYTKLALEAILQLNYAGLEIVVWDNGSTDGTVEYLQSRLTGVCHAHLELSPTNRGVVYPMNAVWGLGHDVELLAKIDNDTLVPPELIRRLAECHMASSHFGVLSGFHFRKEGEAIADENSIVIVNGVRVLRQQYVGGCAVMVRREVFDQVGPIPGNGAGENHPFMDNGWTEYQERLSEVGLINGYPWPPIHVDHMEDTRSPRCVRTEEHQNYKRAMRGMSLEEFTDELCVWRPH